MRMWTWPGWPKLSGCYAERVERPADIGGAMERAFAAGKIAVLDMVSDIDAMGPVARLEDVRASAFS